MRGRSDLDHDHSRARTHRAGDRRRPPPRPGHNERDSHSPRNERHRQNLPNRGDSDCIHRARRTDRGPPKPGVELPVAALVLPREFLFIQLRSPPRHWYWNRRRRSVGLIGLVAAAANRGDTALPTCNFVTTIRIAVGHSSQTLRRRQAGEGVTGVPRPGGAIGPTLRLSPGRHTRGRRRRAGQFRILHHNGTGPQSPHRVHVAAVV